MAEFLFYLEAPLIPSDEREDNAARLHLASLNHDPEAYRRGLEEAGLTA